MLLVLGLEQFRTLQMTEINWKRIFIGNVL